MTTHKQERERKRFEAVVREELHRRHMFSIKPIALAVRQALRQLRRR